MKLLRLSAPLLIFAVLLAACGGGGGGGTPPTAPGPSSNPGGGGGGGSTPTPSPAPTTSASPAPSASPGGVPVNTGLTITAEEDWGPNGQLWYTSGTASWANTAGIDSSGPTGSAVDGMNCTATTEGTQFPQTAYSQHAFVGIYANGNEMALPQALGMIAPVAPTQGTPAHPNNYYEVEQNQCEYNVHTHDYSGLVHVEDASLPQNSSYSYAPSYATLQTLLDVWSAQLSSTGLTAGASSLSGPVAVYVGTPTTKDSSGNDVVASYTQAAGAPGSVMLARHNAIWIVIGNLPSAGLPQVKFVLEN
jgi:hypothetical protein